MDVLIPNSSLICQEKLEDEVMLTETENVFSKMRECSLAQIPSYNKLTIETFVELCKIHQRFIEKSVVFDIYLLAHAFLLLDKANLADEDLTDHYFFSALYLATATDEDFHEGLDEIIYYHIGTFHRDTKRRYVKVDCRQEFVMYGDYMKNLERFFKIRNVLWVSLEFQTMVSLSDLEDVVPKFRKAGIVIYAREPEDLKEMCECTKI